MPIAVTDEHQEQRRSIRRWLDAHCPPSVPRALLDAEVEELQPVWKELAAQGWLGLHLPEQFGGEGFGPVELAVLLEETGRSLVPGPVLPTVATSALVNEAASADLAGAGAPGSDRRKHAGHPVLRRRLPRRGGARADGELVVSGTLRPLLGASTASRGAGPGPSR